MKIFSPPESNAPKAVESKKTGKASKKAKPTIDTINKKEMSESAIREKLASHVETSNTSKSKVLQKNAQTLGAGFMNPDALPVKLPVVAKVEGEDSTDEATDTETPKESKSLKDSHLLLSDVKLNDPNDSNTQEKLKSVLKMGAFKFNPKEKDALEKILAGS